MPKNRFVLELINILGKPITSTSANVSGGKTCVSVEEFLTETSQEKLKLVDLFVDGGIIVGKLPSTIVDISKGKVEIVRMGEVKVEM